MTNTASTPSASDPLAQDFTTAASGGLPSGVTAVQVTPGETIQQQMQAVMAQYGDNPQLMSWIQSNIPYAGWAMSNAELKPILITAAVQGWGQGEVSAAIETTNWYKTQGQNVRQWMTLTTTDPATAGEQLAVAKNDVLTQAQSVGVTMTDAQLTQEATNYLMFGWDQDTLDQDLKQNWYPRQQQQPGTPAAPQFGSAAQFYNQAQSLLQNYLVPMSNQTLGNWTTKAVQGQADINGFETYLRQQAQTLFPFMSTSLQQGMTPKDWLSPYTQQAAQTLGVSPDSINWSDPKWMDAITQTASDGTKTAKGLLQFTNDLRSNPIYGYQYSQDARDQAYAMSASLLKTFGKVAS